MGQQQVKVTQELKNIQVEQMTKLQAKHQAECDLLEDMRTFSQKKAAIEREYAQLPANWKEKFTKCGGKKTFIKV
nr:F-BAR and double SH3 domains protein 2-like isoform X2 [Manis javanica]